MHIKNAVAEILSLPEADFGKVVEGLTKTNEANSRRDLRHHLLTQQIGSEEWLAILEKNIIEVLHLSADLYHKDVTTAFGRMKFDAHTTLHLQRINLRRCQTHLAWSCDIDICFTTLSTTKSYTLRDRVRGKVRFMPYDCDSIKSKIKNAINEKVKEQYNLVSICHLYLLPTSTNISAHSLLSGINKKEVLPLLQVALELIFAEGESVPDTILATVATVEQILGRTLTTAYMMHTESVFHCQKSTALMIVKNSGRHTFHASNSETVRHLRLASKLIRT